jgi:protein-tyrosine phosphatase
LLDLHTHILHGLDDGAPTLDDSVAMARAAVADGISLVAATPHVRDDYPTHPSQMERLVAELQSTLATESVPLEIRPGGEIALDRLGAIDDEQLRRFGLAGNPKYLLLEFPYYGWPLALATRIFELRGKRIDTVIAHPERNAEVQAEPERLRPLVDQGAFVQLTAASLDGRLGRGARTTALRLLELELAHLVSSDAHAPDVRGIGMSAACEAVGDDGLSRWLTEDMPAAIVAGERLPPRPITPRRRRRLFRS